jgi:hypothetical protein
VTGHRIAGCPILIVRRHREAPAAAISRELA